MSTYRFYFHKAGFSRLENLLNNLDFEQVTNHADINVCVSNFYTLIFNCFELSVPYSCQKSLSSSPAWYNKELRALSNKRNSFWHKYLQTGNQDFYLNYLNLVNEFTVLSERFYEEYLSDMQHKLITDPIEY